MCEIGILLIAFAPLDVGLGVALNDKRLGDTWPFLVVFLVAGVIAFAIGAVAEWRIRR